MTAAAYPRLVTLMRYTAWANQRLYACIAGLPSAQLEAPTPVFAGSILRTLNHVCLIDRVWKAHLEGVPHGFTTRNPETTPVLDTLRRNQTVLDAWFIDCASGLDPATCDEVVRFAFIGGGNAAMTRAEIITHVANHTTYHRGHVTAMLYALGIQPPVTDLPVFFRTADTGA